MATHTIKIEGLPEGWEPVAYRKLTYDEDVHIWLPTNGVPFKANDNFRHQFVFIVQKTKPRRIVLEETDVESDEFSTQEIMTKPMKLSLIGARKIWRIKEE